MKDKKVYLIGGAKGTYRTQNLVKFFLDQHCQVYYNNFIPNTFKECSGIKKYLRLVVRGFDEIIQMSNKIYNLILADYVIMAAMCQHKQFELVVGKLLRKHIITDFYMSQYDSTVRDRDQIDKISVRAGKLYRKDKNVIKLASQVLFLNKTEAKYYLNLLDLKYDAAKHKSVPLCVEPKKKCKLNYYLDTLNDVVFNICWWGNYIPLHGLKKIINAANILNQNYKIQFHMHLFGTSEEKAIPYKTLIEELNLKSIITIHNDKTFNNGKLEPFLVESCSLVLGNFGDSEKANHVLVNKLLDGVAMKAPVLTGESIAPKEYFSKETIFYTNNNAESIAEMIFQISQLKSKKVVEIVETNHEIYEQHFSPKAYEGNLKKVFE